MRFIGRRALKYIGFPAIVSSALIWKGSHHYKSERSWPTNDVLLNVQVIHRHGDRLPMTPLRDDRDKENELWSKQIRKTQILDTDERSQWKYVSNQLNGTYIVHKQDNYNMNSEYLVSSKDNDAQTQDILSNMYCWDRTYPAKRANWCGQITDKGVIGMMALGSWLRQRYVEQLAFLAPTFQNNTQLSNPHINIQPISKKQQTFNKETPSVYYISTNFLRTVYSADALLQGLYPLKSRTNDSSIPIHVDQMNTWLYPGPACKRSRKRQKENEAQLTKDDEEDMIAIKKKLCAFYGVDENDRSWLHICDALGCRLSHDIDVPPVDYITKHEMKQFIDYVSMRMCKYHCMDRSSMRLATGVLLKKLVDNMSDLENKFVVYSAHDGTLQRLLVALANGKDFRFPWPSYSSSLIFEVWEKNIVEEEDKSDFVMGIKDWINGVNKSRAKYVRILYEGNVMYLNGNEFIALTVFQQMWSDLMIDEETFWNRECVC